MVNRYATAILNSREPLMQGLAFPDRISTAAEGGCGVIGFAANILIPGRHVLTASRQMHNRGNGKGGGIAMVGLDPNQARVSQETLNSHHLLQIALMDHSSRREIEQRYIFPYFDISQAYELNHFDDHREIEGLSVKPPDVWRYFVQTKRDVLDQFAEENNLTNLLERALEDEFVYQNSFRLNREFYASIGEKRAFVLSHGRNLSVLKIVGYAENVVEYYLLDDQTAHVWISHQRYPTKGRVWHPGGAHPFIGLNEALVHNGDFANYHAVSEYLQQRNIGQLFLTDTEVSAQLFDLWDRVYGYPLEITLEAMAPTTEFDFEMLPEGKKEVYQAVQRAHMHGSPDGPWFFIVARSVDGRKANHSNSPGLQLTFELLGITDTSMLRPQVFALYENPNSESPVQIGLVASERQAINACLRSLSSEDKRFRPVADRYWAARGGSYTDGGAFRLSVSPESIDRHRLDCENKFGKPIRTDSSKNHYREEELSNGIVDHSYKIEFEQAALRAFDDGGSGVFWKWFMPVIASASWRELAWSLNWLESFAVQGSNEFHFALSVINFLRDRRYDTGLKKRASIITLVDQTLLRIFDPIPTPGDGGAVRNTRSFALLANSSARTTEQAALINVAPTIAGQIEGIVRLAWENRDRIELGKLFEIVKPKTYGDSEFEPVLVLDAANFPPEGDESAACWLVRAYTQGWRRIIAYNWQGGRFAGCGVGASSHGLQLDLYGDVGDYAASGLDGAVITIHGDGQDQVGQIIKSGRLVIHGDAGQTFLYGAKGGEIFVLGSVGGRPLINAVGRPRAVINGTCLDYLAESFMAGDPLHGGGFVILNGVSFDETGRLCELDSPYPGGNLFSLASGGAVYVRDPHKHLQENQLNGGAIRPLADEDWNLIKPYLITNEELFDIRLEDLLSVDGVLISPQEVYRKVVVINSDVLKEDSNR